MHKGSGAIKDHMQRCHNLPLNRNVLVNNTKILLTNNDPTRFLITGARLIHAKYPVLNQQATGLTRTLKFHCSRPRSRTTRNSSGHLCVSLRLVKHYQILHQCARWINGWWLGATTVIRCAHRKIHIFIKPHGAYSYQ